MLEKLDGGEFIAGELRAPGSDERGYGSAVRTAVPDTVTISMFPELTVS